MNYAIHILEQEKDLISRCLTEWETKKHPQAKKERERRLRDISKAIELIKKQDG